MLRSSIIVALSLLLVKSAVAGPLAPKEALKTFQLADPALTIELVACEPEIENPVAMAFDAVGRLYVTEMRNFQQGVDFTGVPGSCRVKMLEDRDGDGHFEHSTIFAKDMNYPTAVMPHRDGILVGAAPDLFFLKDTNGDGVADIREVVLTGFGLSHEQLLNSFQWGLDNWVHLASGGAGGNVRAAGQPERQAVAIGIRNMRFRTGFGDTPATFELTSGGGQYGLTSNDWGDWFTSHNARHIMHIVLPDEYLRRNPALAAPAVLVDIPDHGAASRIYRISPLEDWRVERTRRRAASQPEKYMPTELHPGGYITAACGNLVYRGDWLPLEYYGDAFVCDASNNLVHRDRLVPDGVSFIAKRTDDREREFLASTDNWFRPVTAATGPDGALYVIDMYHEIIETPSSIPPDILKTVSLKNGEGMGRIYRIRPRSKTSPRPPSLPPLDRASPESLVVLLSRQNAWWRMLGQRVLVERQEPSARRDLERLVKTSKKPLARLHALCTLDGSGLLSDAITLQALNDPEPRIRAHALRFKFTDGVLDAALNMADDPSPHVRFQLAFTLGEFQTPEAFAALAKIAERDAADRWIRTAILSSAGGPRALELWQALHAKDSTFFKKETDVIAFARELTSLIGAQADDKTLSRVLTTIHENADAEWRAAELEGLTEGISRSGTGKQLLTSQAVDALQSPDLIFQLMTDKQTAVRQATRRLATRLAWPPLLQLQVRIEREITVAVNDDEDLAERVSAIAFLGSGQIDQVAKPLEELIEPDQPVEIQEAAVTALARMGNPKVAAMLLARSRWQTYTPAVAQTVINALLARAEYLPALLDALENGDIPAWSIEPARQKHLLEHPNEKIRARAKTVLSAEANTDRIKVYDAYKEALNRVGNPQRGKDVFKTNCSACHQLEGAGHVVGPDLTGVRDRETAALLTDIIIPSQAITSGFNYYLLDTEDGESITGLIAGESASAITLRQREGAERTILRSNIKSLYASSISMMPEDMEKTINPEQMADLIAYLKAAK